MTSYLSFEEARAESWFNRELLTDTWIVTNTDLDGLLSLALLRRVNPSLKFAGFYTGDALLLTAEAEQAYHKYHFNNFLAVECDLYLMRSIGHHFTRARSQYDHLNPNHLRGFASGFQFTRKFPLNMLVLLWRWFNLTIPENGPDRRSFLKLLFYPDGILLKVVQQYESNCRDWLTWLGLGVTTDELKAIAKDPSTVQLARCIYKNFGNTQLGLTFTELSNAEAQVKNLEKVQLWSNRFCELLGLPPIELPLHFRRTQSFHQNRFSLRHPDELPVVDSPVSDAQVKRDVWSVTLVSQQASNIGLADGLTNEVSRWISSLGLNAACRNGVSICRKCQSTT